jgi:hypothetical protein
MTGAVRFRPDEMRGRAHELDAVGAALEELGARIAHAPLPAMPSAVAAAVRAGLLPVAHSTQRNAHDARREARELRVRATLAEFADDLTPRALDVLGDILDATEGGLSACAAIWARHTWVRGHWRTLADGTRVAVSGHWRNLGRTIQSHARLLERLGRVGRAVGVFGNVLGFVETANAFRAPAERRGHDVGKAAGGWAGGAVGGYYGAQLGATLGMAGGPVGVIAGAAVGGVIGAVAGSAIGRGVGGFVGRHVFQPIFTRTNLDEKAGRAVQAVSDTAGKAVKGAKSAIGKLNPFD